MKKRVCRKCHRPISGNRPQCQGCINAEQAHKLEQSRQEMQAMGRLAGYGSFGLPIRFHFGALLFLLWLIPSPLRAAGTVVIRKVQVTRCTAAGCTSPSKVTVTKTIKKIAPK